MLRYRRLVGLPARDGNDGLDCAHLVSENQISEISFFFSFGHHMEKPLGSPDVELLRIPVHMKS